MQSDTPCETHTGGFEVRNNIALTVTVCIGSFEAIGELPRKDCISHVCKHEVLTGEQNLQTQGKFSRGIANKRQKSLFTELPLQLLSLTLNFTSCDDLEHNSQVETLQLCTVCTVHAVCSCLCCSHSSCCLHCLQSTCRLPNMNT